MSIFFADVAERLLDNGYTPIPVIKKAKRPAISEWPTINYHTNPGLLDRLCRDYPDASTGIVLGQVCAVDIDVLDEKTARTIKALIISRLGDAPCRVGKPPKSALFFCVEGPAFSKLATQTYEIGNQKAQVEFLCSGQQAVVFGKHPDTAKPYFWENQSILNVDISRLPKISQPEAKSLLHELEHELVALADLPSDPPAKVLTENRPNFRTHRDDDNQKIVEALSFIDPQNYDCWIAVGHALKSADGRFLPIFLKWSQQRPDGSIPRNFVSDEDVTTRWKSFEPARTSIAAIFSRAARLGFAPSETLVNATDNYPPGDIESMVDRMNEDWFVAFLGGKVLVCRERVDIATGDQVIDKFPPEEFNKAFANKTRSIGSRVQKDSVIWFQHPRRREYPMGIVCDPTNKVDGRYFNSWRGFAIPPSGSDPTPLIDHIEQIICSRDPEIVSYVTGWLAQAVQRPEDPAGTVLVLRGRQGTGKGLLGTAMLRIFGKHGHHIVQAEHLVGRFQGHLEDCVFLFADEAFFPGDPRIKGQLKSMITERLLTMEEKYIQAKPVLNRLSILMASNETFVVPAELDDRRFAVIDVSEAQQNKPEYFNHLWRTVEGSGLSGFLQYLLDFDISKFVIRTLPETAARTEQKEFMFDTGMAFLAWGLRRGAFYDGSAYEDSSDFFEWPEFISTQLLYGFFERWYQNERPRGRKLRQNELGELLKKFLHSSRPSGNSIINLRRERGERPHGYKFGTLEETRENFEKAFQLKNFSWPEVDAGPIIIKMPF